MAIKQINKNEKIKKRYNLKQKTKRKKLNTNIIIIKY